MYEPAQRRANAPDSLVENAKQGPRAIAFYLPQYHPVPENDEWWGKGFTEWRNVAKARPLFKGHYQPHLPADLGFYDLRLPEVREAQAMLARQYGIHGFCYYHYWFNGRRILERPFNEVIASGKPELPFCLCWANENWTRVWDGGENHVLLGQDYGIDDDLAHIRSLLPAFRDSRYIRIDDKPLFLVYRAELLPDPIETAARWRNEVRNAGLPGLYLARVESYASVTIGADPRSLGFDADVEFPPFSWPIGCALGRRPVDSLLRRVGMQPRAYGANKVIPYAAMSKGVLDRPEPSWQRFPGVSPSWDNSARRSTGASIFPGSTPELYEAWLLEVVRRRMRVANPDERIVFVNAWNEWAEGNHLEPDMRWGHAYLEATKSALDQARALGPSMQVSSAMAPQTRGDPVRRAFWRLAAALKRR